MSEMITKNHALVAQFGDTLDRLLDGIENFVTNSRPTLGGERFPGLSPTTSWAARFSTRNRTSSGCLPPITGKRSDSIIKGIRPDAH